MIAELIVDVGFTAPTTGTVLHLNDPVRGIIGTNTIGSADLFTDITEYVVSVHIREGATRADGPVLRYEAGTCTIVLRNDDRRFDPTNLSGPYVAGGVTQVEPMRAVRVRAVWGGVAYPLFRGFTDDWQVSYDGPNSSYVTLTCFDAFGVFATYDRTASTAVGAGEDTGARISRILDSVAWSDEDRLIDTGDETVQSTTLADNALSEMLLTADTELGHLYMDTSGRVRFRRRLAEQEEARSLYAQVCFGDSPADGDTTVNLATNPSLETGLDGWDEGGTPGFAPTFTQSSTRAVFGTYSLLATWATATGAHLPLIQYTASGLTEGRTYTVSVYAYVPTGSPYVALFVPGINQWGDGTFDTFDQWVRLEWTGTATSSTLLVQLWPENSTTTAGQQVWVDGLQIEEGATATDYCDGDQTGCEWDGVAHASTSRRLPELPYADAPLVYDRQTIANLVSIANSGGTAQVVEDSASRSAYLTKTYQRHDLLGQTDTEALIYAEQVIARSATPELRFSHVELKPSRDDRLWAHALGRSFGDRVRVKRRPPGGGDTIEREAHIRGVEHEITAEQRWVTRLVLQQAPTYSTVTDSFARSESNGWGIADSGQAWTTSGGSASDFSVAGGVGSQSHGTVNTFRNSLVDVGSPNQSVSVDVSWPIGSPTGSGTTVWVVARVTDTSNYYVARLDLSTAGQMSMLLARRVGGSFTTVASSTPVAANTAGDWWRVTFRAVGTQLRATAQNLTSGSGTVTLTATDSTLTTGDLCGVLSRLEAGNTDTLPVVLSVDNFTAESLHAWT